MQMIEHSPTCCSRPSYIQTPFGGSIGAFNPRFQPLALREVSLVVISPRGRRSVRLVLKLFLLEKIGWRGSLECGLTLKQEVETSNAFRL